MQALFLNGRLIKAARALLGWSQTDLAEQTSISLSTIRRIETISSNPNKSTQKLLIQCFEQNNLVINADDTETHIKLKHSYTSG
jgi:ribosome-binding protein aMBF1 (putative translation factor)